MIDSYYVVAVPRGGSVRGILSEKIRSETKDLKYCLKKKKNKGGKKKKRKKKLE